MHHHVVAQQSFILAAMWYVGNSLVQQKNLVKAMCKNRQIGEAVYWAKEVFKLKPYMVSRQVKNNWNSTTVTRYQYQDKVFLSIDDDEIVCINGDGSDDDALYDMFNDIETTKTAGIDTESNVKFNMKDIVETIQIATPTKTYILKAPMMSEEHKTRLISILKKEGMTLIGFATKDETACLPGIINNRSATNITKMVE